MKAEENHLNDSMYVLGISIGLVLGTFHKDHRYEFSDSGHCVENQDLSAVQWVMHAANSNTSQCGICLPALVPE